MTRDVGQERVRRETAATLLAFEAAFADGAGAPGGPTVADFRAVGLCEADACRARNGMTSGAYLTFEDAAVAVSTFGAGEGTRLDLAALRERAAAFDSKPVVEGARGDDQLRESLREPIEAFHGSVTEAELDARMERLRRKASETGAPLARLVADEVATMRELVEFRGSRGGRGGSASGSPATKREIGEADARAFLYGTTTTEGDQ